jgi:hypothetical protein
MLALSSSLPLALTVAALILVGSALGNKNATATPHSSRKTKANIQQSTVVKGSYIVLLNAKTSAAKVNTIATGTAATMQTLKQQLIANGTLQATANDVVDVPTDRIWTKSVKAFLINGVSESMVPTLRQTTGVISVEPNVIHSINGVVENESTFITKDPPGTQRFRSLSETQMIPWGVMRVGGPIDINTVPNPKGRVFVVDSGISTQTNDLIIDKTLSINFVPDSSGIVNPTAWEDDHGHGTHISGTIAALNNGINVVGVVPGATVVAIKVLDATGSTPMDRVISGIEYIYINGKKGDVVNLSFGSFNSNNPDTEVSAVESTASLGIKFAISAGNSAADATDYRPAKAFGTNIYTVSCCDQTDTFCSFSNFGQVVDVASPGLNIPSLSRDGNVEYRSGTSMSAPHIAGLLFANSFKTDGYVIGDKDPYPDPIFVYAGVVSPPTIPPSNDLIFTIYPDIFSGTETSWTLTRTSPGSPTIVASRPVGTYPPGNIWISTVSNLAVGSYRFSLYDSFGDGLSPPAYYILSFDNGVVLKSGSAFRNADITFFDVTSTPLPDQPITIVTTASGVAPIPYMARAPSNIVGAKKPAAKKTQKPKKK